MFSNIGPLGHAFLSYHHAQLCPDRLLQGILSEGRGEGGSSDLLLLVLRVYIFLQNKLF